MEFEKWLKKNKQFDRYGSSLTHSENSEVNMEEFVSVSDLGEWAWKEYVELKDNYASEDNKGTRTAMQGEIMFTWQVAKACLGKEEIERRLKEMN